jgi:membrane-bound lytic murein transglycosylase F
MGASKRLVSLLAALALLFPACGRGPTGDEADGAAFIDGDLAAIMERGELRILLPKRMKDPQLPRKGYSLDFERELAGTYAFELGVEPFEIFVDSRDRLIPDLLAGRGDLVAANLTATAARKKKVAFSVPVAVVREQLVTRVDDLTISSTADLDGRRIALRPSSSFWETVSRLRERYPGIEIVEVDEDVDTEEIIHRVATGEYDLTVADSNLVEACLEYRDDIRPALDLTRDRPIALAVRKSSPGLLENLNRYLIEAQLTDRTDGIHLEDFPEIKRRRVLRMLTRNNAASYFLWRGELMGFEYDLVREFARRNGLRLEVIIPPVGEDLLPWLREGKGDLVAAALTPTEERREGGVEFTRPYNYVAQVIVARADDPVASPEELAGRRIHVRSSSAYWQTLEGLRAEGVALELVAAPEELETEEIIAMVASGEYDLTLSDSHILEIELNWRDDVRPAFALSDSQPLAWAVRGQNPELRSALDRFIAEEYRGLYYNVIYEKYFRDTGKIRTRRSENGQENAWLSPYDNIVKKYAARYGFDWRLIVSMMYQESRFNPEARSFAGAGGLMQVLPNTADDLGFDDIIDPDNGIHAGVKYLDWVRDRFEPELSVPDRMWFSLAAYNVGAGHVRDARRLAARLGLNPNRWFDNVEQAMLLLSRPQYAQAARHGYCRSMEPVKYVREVRSRYNAYVESIGPYPDY